MCLAASATPLRAVTIVTTGSRGDIQPFVAIGAALKKAGHEVRVMTHTSPTHVALVESMGLTAVPLGGCAEHIFKTNPKLVQAMATGDPVMFLQSFAEATENMAPGLCAEFYQEMTTNRPDLIITSRLLEFFAWYAIFKLKIPSLVVHLHFAALNEPKRAPYGFPTLPMGLHTNVMRQFVIPCFYESATKLDEVMAKQTGQPRFFEDCVSKAEFVKVVGDGNQCFVPSYLCQSPQFRNILYPSAPSDLPNLGSAIMDKASEESSTNNSKAFGGSSAKQAITEFLQAEPDRKPVYMGWGSMLCKSSAIMTEFAVRALMISGQRGIILGGWAGLGMEALEAEQGKGNEVLIAYAKKNILFVDRAPHEWLFPQMACTVHHGGAGTLAAAMRAGVPTIVTPVFMDQYDHSHLVNGMGVGIGLSKQLQKTSAHELAAAIQRVIRSPEMAITAQHVGTQLRQEDGAGAMALEVQKYWFEQVQTGKFVEFIAERKETAKKFKEEHYKAQIQTRYKTLAVVSSVVAIAACAFYPLTA